MTVSATPVPATASATAPALSDELRTGFLAALDEAAANRLAQLADLPPPDDDLVVGAQRDSLERILSEIEAARERLAAGTFGRCQRCDVAIPEGRLELRPWTTYCVTCAAR